jgi:hypothetical protein
MTNENETILEATNEARAERGEPEITWQELINQYHD